MILVRACFAFVLAMGVPLHPQLTAAEADAAWVQSLERAALAYNRDLEAATQQLVETRARVAEARTPIAEAQRMAQGRVLALETSIDLLSNRQARGADQFAQLRTEVEGLERTIAYLTSAGRDALAGLDGALLPGEAAVLGKQVTELQARAATAATASDLNFTHEVAAVITTRLQKMLGGHRETGVSLLAGSNELTPGTFLWLGPEVFFRADREGIIGTVRTPEGVTHPITHPLALHDRALADALFRGEGGTIALDASGGKALRLQEVRGTWRDHIKKGGIIGYCIIALGALAVLTTLLKLLDIGRLALDAPDRIRVVLELVATRPLAEAAPAIAALRPTARELFSDGVKHLDKPKVVLEDNLYATLLRQRMELERRLPFLSVIVAAAPLLGLLGTVTGMVKTFTLINVFGTGNAAKLSSGISEALVTTELGLMVAIPTLVVHGYLNRRTQKNLSLMERYAAEFVAIAAERTLAPSPAPRP